MWCPRTWFPTPRRATSSGPRARGSTERRLRGGLMCGIVGLFAKSAETEARLGAHLADMLVQMSDRGPDSAGIAIYREPVAPGMSRVSLQSPDPRYDWWALE